MEKEKTLLDETLQHLSQAIDMIDMMSVACTSLDKSDMIGPLDILKRDLQSLYFKIDQHIYPQ